MLEVESQSYECRCGKIENKPKGSGLPDGWRVFSHRDGKSLVCDDCVRMLDFSQHSSVAPTSPNPPTPIAAEQPDKETELLLRSGVLVDLADPDYSRVHIRDIAAGLARECRFAGQLYGYYSVAQHLVTGARLILENKWANGIAFCFLMHDAAEAVIKDIPRPLKLLLPDYRAIEEIHESHIWARFGVGMDASAKKFVKRYDEIMLAGENMAVRAMSRERACKPLPTCDWRYADRAAAMIREDAGKTGWERPFLDAFFSLAPLEVLNDERSAA